MHNQATQVSNECWTQVLHWLNWPIPRALAHEGCYDRARNGDKYERKGERERERKRKRERLRTYERKKERMLIVNIFIKFSSLMTSVATINK